MLRSRVLKKKVSPTVKNTASDTKMKTRVLQLMINYIQTLSNIIITGAVGELDTLHDVPLPIDQGISNASLTNELENQSKLFVLSPLL